MVGSPLPHPRHFLKLQCTETKSLPRVYNTQKHEGLRESREGMQGYWAPSHPVTWTLKDWGSSRLYAELGPAEMLLRVERPVEISMVTLLKWQRAA